MRPRPLLVLASTLALLLCVPPSHSQPRSASLVKAIQDADWQAAMASYQATPAPQAIAALRAMAEGNVVMAQWFLADALAATGKGEEAARWLYSASLGTRMDASVCRIKEAQLVEYRFIRAFSRHFDPVRANPRWRRTGLEAAVAFHRSRMDRSAGSQWVCQLVAREIHKVPRNPLRPEKQWAKARARVMEDYQRETGMDFSRTPDLFRINPAH